jgi:uncharacterized membrane protein
MPNESSSSVTSTGFDDLKKFWLAIVFVFIGLIGIAILSVMLVNSAKDTATKAYEAAQTIFNAVLPLLGTWIGGILAYYFGAKQVENMKTQQEQTLELVKRQAEENKASQELLTAQMRHIETLSKPQ